MNGKLKTLGLALVAALALTAVIASAASAQFTSSSSHTMITGAQSGNHEFTAGEGFAGVVCGTTVFSGTGSSTNDADCNGYAIGTRRQVAGRRTAQISAFEILPNVLCRLNAS